MHALLLTFALVTRALPGQAVLDRPSFQPLSLVAPVAMTLVIQQTPPQQPPAQIDVKINRGGGRAWYASPVWIAIGAIALVLVILLIVMAARGGGGGTTVVRG